ncbi:unnamed protein product [Dicrocoelium dendriticum]|nr:unnamed protein product [Dicrocoelium dendriticum]
MKNTTDKQTKSRKGDFVGLRSVNWCTHETSRLREGGPSERLSEKRVRLYMR